LEALGIDPGMQAETLEYTHELEASGVPREQAEGHAKAMTATSFTILMPWSPETISIRVMAARLDRI